MAGRVTNLPDGRVELVAEGEKDELEAFRRAIRDETVSWSEAGGGLRGFEIGR